MATQGLLVLCTKQGVQIKLVVGCNGYKMPELVKLMKEKCIRSPYEIFEAAKELQIGCADCRILLHETKNGIQVLRSEEADSPGPLYFKTFKDPWFNPRWQEGFVEHGYRLCVSRDDEGNVTIKDLY